MNTFALIIILTAILSGVGVSQEPPFDFRRHQEALKKMEMKIDAASKDWRLGAQINIRVEITNKGAETVKIPDPPPYSRYDVSVIGPFNQPLSRIPVGNSPIERLNRGAASGRVRDIEAGKSVEEKIRLDELFEFKQVGVYKITFKRQVGIRETPHVLTSNTFVLNVTR